MLNLNTNLSLETVMKSDKLQKIKCNFWYLDDWKGDRTNCEIAYYKKKPESKVIDVVCPAPTIVDIIDASESLFGSVAGEEPYQHVVMGIIIMCEKDKPLKEIEEYIIKNLK